jgi:hypothetical protein
VRGQLASRSLAFRRLLLPLRRADRYLKKGFRKLGLFYGMACHTHNLRNRCLYLRSRAEELRTVGAIMRDSLSRQAMFQMAHTYEMMADLLEKTSKHIKIPCRAGCCLMRSSHLDAEGESERCRMLSIIFRLGLALSKDSLVRWCLACLPLASA